MTEVTKRQLFVLAERNMITPDTEIIVNGVHSTAGKIKDIKFGVVVVENAKQLGQEQNHKQEDHNKHSTAMFNIKVVGLSYRHKEFVPFKGFVDETRIAEDKSFEDNLIIFIINELSKEYEIVASEKKIANAPGVVAKVETSGCLIMLGFLVLMALGSSVGCYTLLAFLF